MTGPKQDPVRAAAIPSVAGVSCIVPAHESAAWIADSIDSILAQTHAPLEVLVLDSGADETSEIAAAYGDPVRVVAVADVGPAHNRNMGARIARGSMLAFLDADDRWLPRKLELQTRLLEARPELGGCVTHAKNVWEEGLGEEAEHYRDHERAGSIAGYALITLLVRRQAFEAVGPLREELWYADSLDWFLRAKDAGIEIELMPEMLVEHRISASNMTRRGTEKSKSEFLARLRQSIAERSPSDQE